MSLCVSLVSVCVCVHVCCLSICLLVRNCRILWPLGFDRIMAAALLVDISPNAPTETQPAASGAVYTCIYMCVCVYRLDTHTGGCKWPRPHHGKRLKVRAELPTMYA